MTAPIHNTFAPLATKKQVRLAFALQFQPWRYVHGPQIHQLRQALEDHFDRSCSTFASGRQAIVASLQAIGIEPGDEVLLQAYTCTVVPNAISTLGATPVYCDIEEQTLNIDLQSIRSKITPHTKAIICQHTFGIPAKLTELRALCDEHELVLIEDCAHTIPTKVGSTSVGKVGDITIVSFGRDKAISGVAGGAALTRNQQYAAALQRREEQAKPLTWSAAAKLLAYPLRYNAAKAFWHIGLGLPYLKLVQLCKGLPAIYTPQERQGFMSKTLQKLPNGCAILALKQLRQLSAFNRHREALAKLYQTKLTTHAVTAISGIHTASAPQKYPILVPNRDQVLRDLRAHKIYLQDGWSGAVINPPSIASTAALYPKGSAPVAERVSSRILNLPTHPTTTTKQAERLITALTKVLSEQPYKSTDSTTL